MASPIRMTGMASGLDTESIVTALTSGYKTKVDNYKKAQTKVSWKQDAWKDVNKEVYSLYTSLDSMRFSTNWKMQKATSSNTNKATVTSNGKAFTGVQTLKINKVATTANMTGGQLDSGATGSTTLGELGYLSGQTATINVNGQELKVKSSDTVDSFIKQLQEKAGLSASFDTSQHRIFISARKSGAEGDFNLTGDENGINALSALGLLTAEKSTVAESTYGAVLTGLVADPNNTESGLAKTDQATENDVTAQLIKNINGKVAEYNKADTIVKNNTKSRDNIDVGFNYANIYKEYNDSIGANGYNFTEEDLSQLDLLNKDGDYIMVAAKQDDGDYKKYNEYTLVPGSGNVYSTGTGTDAKYIIKDGDSYYNATAVTKTGEDGKETTTYEKTGDAISSDQTTIKSSTDYKLSLEVVDKIAAKMFADKGYTTYDAIESDDDKAKVATEAMKIAGQKLSLSNYEDDAKNNKDAVNTFEASDDTTKLVSQQNIVDAVHKAYSMGTDAAWEDMITQFNTDRNANASVIGTQSKVLTDDAVVKDLAEVKTDKLQTKDYDTEVKNFAQKIKDAFVNQAKENKAVSNLTKDGVTSAKAARKMDGSGSQIELNGVTYTGDSNNFSINGLNITVMSETKEDEPVTITTQTDSQGLYDKIKDFFSTYNDVINDLMDRYNAESASGYEPLTDDEKSQMSDSQVEKWEKKVKTGLLRRDDTLDGIINSMTSAMLKTYKVNNKTYSLGTLGIMTKGILNAATNRQYEYHIDGDEDDSSVSSNADKLMTAINSDPDSVIEFMQDLTNGLYSALDKKMKTTSLKTAYTVYNDKEMASEYSSYNSLISQWETRLSDMEDSYYKKFSKMESTLSTLQSSTSSLTGMFGS